MQELFSPLKPHIIKALNDLPKALDAVMPLQAKHRRALPQGIEELSSRLTVERGLIKQSYWSAPRLTSAYLWYFLPWNILRLSRLLSNLVLPRPEGMPIKAGGILKPRVFMDMGSGPLSLPIALWLTKPEWRELPLNVLCLDTAVHPLELGQKLFLQLAGKNSPWRIIPMRAKLETAHLEIQKIEGVPWLISAANVCNEIKVRQGQEDHAYNILENLQPALRAQDASLLLVEPGTRLGGKTIVNMREAALECGLTPISPCPHQQECPLDDSRTWCHFTFDTHGSPAWLNQLSAAAKLRKTALSLAFILLKQAELTDQTSDKAVTSQDARIISAPFRVPELAGESRYTCSAHGLGLIGNAKHLPSGALVELKPNTNKGVDQKSGAIILEHMEKTEHTQMSAKDFKPIHTKQDKYVKNESSSGKKAAKQAGEVKKDQKIKKKKINTSKKLAKKFWEQ